MSNTNGFQKGEEGEASVLSVLNRTEDIYFFHNLYVKTREKKGNICQIDFVVLTTRDFFVLEVKNISGDVTGSLSQRYWETVLGRKTYRFYNPVLQNSLHINTLKSILPNNILFTNLVLFGDNSRLYNVPRNVKHFGDLFFELRKGEEKYSLEYLEEIYNQIGEYKNENSRLNLEHYRMYDNFWLAKKG